MAPIKYVPHAVHFFLEQVSHGLWNGSAFHLNRHHVLQVGPSTPEHKDRFREMELDRLAFPDYSPHYPHHRWTLGYAGRPGGPSWYVNKIDNRADHGPHGQEHHALSEFADACFGRVVRGFDALERVFRDPSPQIHRASVVGARVVRWEDHWTRDDPAEWRREHEGFIDYLADAGESDDDAGGFFDEDDDHNDRHHHHHHPGSQKGGSRDGAAHPPLAGRGRAEEFHLSVDSTGPASTSGSSPSGPQVLATVDLLKSYYSTKQGKSIHES
jgi:hypothetical protein